MIVFLVFLSVLFAGFYKGKMDAISDIGLKGKQWKNKWKNTEEGWDKDYRKKYHWWYFGLYTPEPYLEKFPFSSTILVFLTDTWHLNQLIMLRFIYLSISIAFTQKIYLIIILTFILFPIILGIPFELSHTYYKKKLNNK